MRRFASGTTHRSSTRPSSASRTVTSDIEGCRNGTKRDRALVTSSRLPSGDSATDHGFRLAGSRFVSSPVARSITEMRSPEVLTT